jgi:hypothetical protein
MYWLLGSCSSSAFSGVSTGQLQTKLLLASQPPCARQALKHTVRTSISYQGRVQQSMQCLRLANKHRTTLQQVTASASNTYLSRAQLGHSVAAKKRSLLMTRVKLKGQTLQQCRGLRRLKNPGKQAPSCTLHTQTPRDAISNNPARSNK